MVEFSIWYHKYNRNYDIWCAGYAQKVNELRYCFLCSLKLRYWLVNLTQGAHGRCECMVEFSFWYLW